MRPGASRTLRPTTNLDNNNVQDGGTHTPCMVLFHRGPGGRGEAPTTWSGTSKSYSRVSVDPKLSHTTLRATSCPQIPLGNHKDRRNCQRTKRAPANTLGLKHLRNGNAPPLARTHESNPLKPSKQNVRMPSGRNNAQHNMNAELATTAPCKTHADSRSASSLPQKCASCASLLAHVRATHKYVCST